VAAALAVVARPLTFASVAPDVAEARGVPVRALDIGFLVLLGLVVTMAVQVVGTLLLFGLVVTPAATALTVTARPALVAALSTALGVAAVVVGLVLAAMFNLPPSFAVITLSTAVWAGATVAARRTRRATAP
jgi:zinc/manganese transport system permease protein